MSIAVIINCDKCKKEISSDTQTVFVGKLLDVRTGIQGMDFLTGAKLQTGNKPVFFQEIIEHRHHLCSLCYREFVNMLNEKKK